MTTAEEKEEVEVKFRLYDGSDIGPFRYSITSTTVSMLKERILQHWPKDKKIAPKVANDIKLINAGKILENSKTVGQCRATFDELPNGVITMHVVVQPTNANTGNVYFSSNRLLFTLTISYFRHIKGGVISRSPDNNLYNNSISHCIGLQYQFI
ncbi:hypothetical protein ACFE04_009290 [Oxalis oulophora]